MAAPEATMLRAEESEETTNTYERKDADNTSDISGQQGEGRALDGLIDSLAACSADITGGYLHVALGYQPHINDKGKYDHVRDRPRHVLRWPALGVEAGHHQLPRRQ
jgi:hypothetical protein